MPCVFLALVISNSAPADKYFGRLKMSALRVRYEIAQLKNDYEFHRRRPEDVEHVAVFAEEAYYDWAAQYPRDTWLPSTGYNLAKLFEDLPGEDARDRALRSLQFVRSHFKNSKYAKLSAADVTRGVPLRPEPGWAASPSPTALLTPAPSAAPTPSPATTASPRP